MHHAICDASIFTRTSTDNSNKYLLLAHDDVMWRSNAVQDLGAGVLLSFLSLLPGDFALSRACPPAVAHVSSGRVVAPTLDCH